MKQRFFIIGTLAAVLTLNAAHSSQAFCRVVHSAQSFQRYYRDLQQDGQELNSFQRIVFSLVLANSKVPEQATGRILPAGRT